MASSHDFVQAASHKRAFLKKQADALETQAREFDAEVERLRRLRAENRQELAGYLLAEVDDDAIKALEERLRFPALAPIKAEFEAELEAAQSELAALEANPEVEHYEFHRSQAKDEIDAITDAHEDLKARCHVWERNDWYLALDARGFFAPGYRPGILDRFRDWRAASHLMADLEKITEFEFPSPTALRDAFVALRGQADPIFELHVDLHSRITDLDTLWARAEELRGAPDRLFAAMFAALSRAIDRHFESCPEELRLELAAQDKHLTTFLKKSIGLDKQIQYLSELKVARLNPMLLAANTEMLKLDQKIFKARRKMKWHDDAAVQKLYVLKEERWEKRQNRLRKARHRVAHFNKYQRGSVASDYLWWDVMTGGAPADDIYEVRTFRNQHPNWRHTDYRDPWERDRAPRAIDRAAPVLADELGTDRDSDWGTDGS